MPIYDGFLVVYMHVHVLDVTCIIYVIIFFNIVLPDHGIHLQHSPPKSDLLKRCWGSAVVRPPGFGKFEKGMHELFQDMSQRSSIFRGMADVDGLSKPDVRTDVLHHELIFANTNRLTRTDYKIDILNNIMHKDYPYLLGLIRQSFISPSLLIPVDILIRG
jgi:hypothetical protein